MADLFGYTKTDDELTLENTAVIAGLYLKFNFISKEEEKYLIDSIDKNNWLKDLKRRVQHYGYKYDYKLRKIDTSFYIGEIPKWLDFLITRLLEEGIINFKPDQAIVNEYEINQGIAAHIDCEPCFGETVISISLGSACVFNFQKEANSSEKDKIPLLLIPRTLVVMKNESRYSWYHGISNRKADKFNGKLFNRKRRISITFRKVILDN